MILSMGDVAAATKSANVRRALLTLAGGRPNPINISGLVKLRHQAIIQLRPSSRGAGRRQFQGFYVPNQICLFTCDLTNRQHREILDLTVGVETELRGRPPSIAVDSCLRRKRVDEVNCSPELRKICAPVGETASAGGIQGADATANRTDRNTAAAKPLPT